jgi:hypothetical protein
MVNKTLTPLLGMIWIGFAATLGQAASLSFTPRELFRIPFGDQRAALGARVEGSNFVFPRDFTMDGLGRFYIFDTKKHRIARFSPAGAYEIGFTYPDTAQQVFAHADSKQNLWLLISDPMRGIYYGVYDPHGQRLREGIFAQFNQFRLHLDDDRILHIILSSRKSTRTQTFIFHEASLLMKKENIGPPPENHHQVQKGNRQFFIDSLPGAANAKAPAINRITDASHRNVAEIKGDVVYITDEGDIYTRQGNCDINVYDLNGRLKGGVTLVGLSSACTSARFDADGNIYELDGIPDASNHYTPDIPGMRLIVWERR